MNLDLSYNVQTDHILHLVPLVLPYFNDDQLSQGIPSGLNAEPRSLSPNGHGTPTGMPFFFFSKTRLLRKKNKNAKNVTPRHIALLCLTDGPKTFKLVVRI